MATTIGGAVDKIQEKLTLWVTVLYLDGSEENLPIKCHLKGVNLYNRVFKRLNLLEREYFGLQFIHQGDDVVWVEHDKLFRKQWNAIKCDCEFSDPIVKLRVKYYVKDPCKLYEARTRHLFYLQLKQDIFLGKMSCPIKPAIQLGSYIAQIELGDYIAIEHEPGYLKDLPLSRGQNEEFERRVSDIHKLHRGLSSREAEIKYLEVAKNLDMYGVHLYRAKNSSSKDIQMGVTLSGLIVYDNGVRVNTLTWCKMNKATFKSKDFVIKLNQGSCGDCIAPIKFSMYARDYAKSFWKTLNDNYMFSRREKCGFTVNCAECKKAEAIDKEMTIRDKLRKTFTRFQSRRFPLGTTQHHTNATKMEAEELEIDNEKAGDPYNAIFHSSLSLLLEGVADGVLEEQYRKLPRKNHKLPITEGKLGCNPEKNYREHILPYDCNRVVLHNGKPSDSYINASYVNINITDSKINRYIATQAPLTNTTAEFWRMVQQENSHLIVMLTAVMENGVHKCHQYWPEVEKELKLSPGFSVKCTIEMSDETGSYVFRELVLIDKSNAQVERSIEHMQFLAWPDDGVPNDSFLFVQFRHRVNDIRTSTRAPRNISSSESPLIVHCSSGISRTGVFILTDVGLSMLKLFEPIYPTDILQSMREQRSGMIQNSKLFRFACECIGDEYVKLMHELDMASI